MSAGLLLCGDLIFVSKIVGTAKTLGLEVRATKDVPTLLRWARESPPACVLVDLHHSGLDLVGLLRELATLGGPRVVGYGSHVDTATLRAAREAGCDPVWPRSKFVEELPHALPQWLAGENTESG